MEKTYYEILKVPYEATQEQIKANFRILIKQTHEDICIKEKNKEKLLIQKQRTQELIEAFNTLKNEEKRKQYDLTLTKEDILRINENHTKSQQSKETEPTGKKLIPTEKKQGYVIRTYYETTIGYKYCKINGQDGFLLKNFDTDKEIKCTNDCYKQYFKKTLLTKKLYITSFPCFIPLQKPKQGIESRLIQFDNNIYIWRENGTYVKIGEQTDFIIENCFLYHKPTKKIFFYECYTGKILEIHGLIQPPIPPEYFLEEPKNKKLTLKNLSLPKKH